MEINHVLVKKTPSGQTYLCFTCNGSYVANFLGAQCVYHRALANIWIANEPDADLFLVSVQLFEKEYTIHTRGHENPFD